MSPQKTNQGIMLVCPKCRRKEKIRAGSSFKIKEKVKHTPLESIAVVEKEVAILPVTSVDCPNCGHNKAEYWSQQTRSTDEPETRFYRCVKCKHTWREYS